LARFCFSLCDICIKWHTCRREVPRPNVGVGALAPPGLSRLLKNSLLSGPGTARKIASHERARYLSNLPKFTFCKLTVEKAVDGFFNTFLVEMH